MTVPSHHDHIMMQIAGMSSPFTVPRAMKWLVRAEEDDQHELGYWLAKLMRKMEPRDWRRLQADRPPWIKPKDIAKLERLAPDDAVEVLGVATLSADGYAREAAFHALGRLGHARAVPYVLLRLGDWVDEVRTVAVSTLRSLTGSHVVRQLIEHHCLVEHLPILGRVDLSGLEPSVPT